MLGEVFGQSVLLRHLSPPGAAMFLSAVGCARLLPGAHNFFSNLDSGVLRKAMAENEAWPPRLSVEPQGYSESVLSFSRVPGAEDYHARLLHHSPEFEQARIAAAGRIVGRRNRLELADAEERSRR